MFSRDSYCFFLLLLSFLVLSSACSVPRSQTGVVSVTGKVVDPRGKPLVGEKIEVILPAEYGLNAMDASYGLPNDSTNSDHQVVLITDALGSFTFSFPPVKYSTSFWFLPPLGSLPRRPPEPWLVFRFPSIPFEHYSVMLKENEEVVYGRFKEAAETYHLINNRPPIEFSGNLSEDFRLGHKAWLADLRLKIPTER